MLPAAYAAAAAAATVHTSHTVVSRGLATHHDSHTVHKQRHKTVAVAAVAVAAVQTDVLQLSLPQTTQTKWSMMVHYYKTTAQGHTTLLPFPPKWLTI